jgi:Ribonuclease G/E
LASQLPIRPIPGGRVLLERAVGETRAVGVDGDGVVFGLYIDRASDAGRRVQFGNVFDGRVSALTPQQGAVFVELDSGIEVMVRPTSSVALAEGQRVTVRIISEAHRGKLARAVLYNGPVSGLSGLQRWQSRLPGGDALELKEVQIGDAVVADAFEDALRRQIFLPGGGRITLSPTPALTAVDVDTAGRKDSGRAASRALNINRLAACSLALEIARRRIGGLVVLDCVAPLNSDAGKQVRNAFLTAFTAFSDRQVKCLAPSALGLMELSLQRREAPIRDILLDADGCPTAETTCLDALRRLAVEARAYPMARLSLHLPEASKAWFDECGLNLQRAIDGMFGARISVAQADREQVEIIKL